MKALGIAAVAVTLLSSTAFAGQVFEFNLGNGKTARIQLRDCGDRFVHRRSRYGTARHA